MVMQSVLFAASGLPGTYAKSLSWRRHTKDGKTWLYWHHKLPDEEKEPQRGSLGISFLIFVILAIGVLAWVTR